MPLSPDLEARYQQLAAKFAPQGAVGTPVAAPGMPPAPPPASPSVPLSSPGGTSGAWDPVKEARYQQLAAKFSAPINIPTAQQAGADAASFAASHPKPVAPTFNGYDAISKGPGDLSFPLNIPQKVVEYGTPAGSISHLAKIDASGKNFSDMAPAEKVQTAAELASLPLGSLLSDVPVGRLAWGAGGAGLAMGATDKFAGPSINRAADAIDASGHPYAAAGARMAPSLLAGFLGGAAGDRAPQAVSAGLDFLKPSKPVMAPQLQNSAEMAAGKGVPFTESAVTPGDVTERSFKDNPSVLPTSQNFYARQKQALDADLQKTGQNLFGDDTLAKTAGQRGEQLQQAVKNFQAQRSAEFGAAEQKIANQVAPGKTPSDIMPSGKVASDKINSFLESKGVPSDETGFNPSLMTGNEAIGQDEAANLIDLSRKIRSATTIGDLVNQKQNFDRAGQIKYSALPDSGEAILKTGRGLINDTITDQLKASPDQAAAKKWAEVNKNYSQTQGPLDTALNAFRNSAPEDFYQKLALNKGSKGIGDLQAMLGKDNPLIKQMAFEDMVQRAKNPQTGEISTDKLNSTWNKTLDPDYKNSVFSPQETKAIQNHLDTRNFVEAPQSIMGIQKNGGSATAAKGAIAKLGDKLTSPVVGTAAGAALGAAVGHPEIGAAAGYGLEKGFQAMRARALQARANAFYNPEPGFYQPQVQPPSTLRSVLGLPASSPLSVYDPNSLQHAFAMSGLLSKKN